MIANQYTSVGGQQRNRTLITFDNGARWHGIAAPVYENGVQTYCDLVRLCILLHM